MKLLVLAPYPFDTVPGQRFRIEQWMPLLREHGVEVDFDSCLSPAAYRQLYRPGRPLGKAVQALGGLARRALDLRRVRRYDVVFLYREAALVGPPLLERLLHGLGVPVIYDFDDAIYLPPVRSANPRFSWLRYPQKTAELCRRATAVTVGNGVLGEYASRYNPNVVILPTTIDTDKYSFRCAYDEAGRPVVGWSGSHTTVGYLERLRPVFDRLARRHPFTLEVIGAPEFRLEHPSIRVNVRPWRSETEVQDLASIQIGLMPLDDDQWARGKCALKALQYMALGIPTVLSPVGANTEVVADGTSGFYARTEDEWVDRLGRLIQDADLRRTLGEAGRKRVLEHYSARVQVPRLVDLLRSLAGGRVRAAA